MTFTARDTEGKDEMSVVGLQKWFSFHQNCKESLVLLGSGLTQLGEKNV